MSQTKETSTEPSRPHARLRVPNFKYLRQQPPTEFEWLRIDANDNCNLKCVYCRVPRSDGMMDAADLQAFFDENVISVENLQFGCGMEPTIDDRLADLMLMAANSKAKPRRRFVLQTNGLMLHTHDFDKFNAAGLDRLSVSMDTMDGDKHKSHRGGSSLNKVVNNLQTFKLGCPTVEIQLLAVVTKLNVGDVGPLVEFAVDLGASSIVFREMVYIPESDEVDHEVLRPMVLEQGQFQNLEKTIRSKFDDSPIHLGFLSRDFLDGYRDKANEASNPKP